MRRAGLAGLVLLTAALGAQAADYSLGPDSLPQLGVPKGEVTQYTWTSTIFPGTVRDYWVYVPKQYDPSRPACVMVFQDGQWYVKEDGDWRVPTVTTTASSPSRTSVLSFEAPMKPPTPHL